MAPNRLPQPLAALVPADGLGPSAEHVADVLAFQAANGGPFPRSLELEYAVRRLALRARQIGLPRAALAAWLSAAIVAACGASAPAARRVARQAGVWVAEEYSRLGGARAASA